MIGISQLYARVATTADPLRYGRDSGRLPAHLLRFSQDRKPVVVWNCSRRCNLRCIHCYADSENQRYPNELTAGEARTMIDDLAQFGVPVLLFSGGEPLMRRDVLALAAYAGSQGIRPVISTNGTLITRRKAEEIVAAGIAYVGVSLDGIRETNDYFRGRRGAFDLALRGIRNCVAAGQKVGLRLTLTRHNYRDLPRIFELIEREEIDRACFLPPCVQRARTRPGRGRPHARGDPGRRRLHMRAGGQLPPPRHREGHPDGGQPRGRRLRLPEAAAGGP